MDIREQIAVYFYFSTGKPRCDTKSSLKIADQILAIKVGEDRVCPKCNGSKKEYPYFDHHYSNRCSGCNGTGKLPPKTIGECIEGV